MPPRRYRRRQLTDGAGLAVVTVPVHVRLERVVGTWTGGAAGTVTVAVDGSTIAAEVVAAGVGTAVVRPDRPELVPEAATITVALPAAGTVELVAVNADGGRS